MKSFRISEQEDGDWWVHERDWVFGLLPMWWPNSLHGSHREAYDHIKGLVSARKPKKITLRGYYNGRGERVA